jgi:hypothetical protein
MWFIRSKSTVQCSVLTLEHAGGDVMIGNGACVGVVLLLKMTQNILIFGTPYVEHCVHTRFITEWRTAYSFDSKIIHKNCKQKQRQTHKHATEKHVKLCPYETRNNIGNAVQRNNEASSYSIVAVEKI